MILTFWPFNALVALLFDSYSIWVNFNLAQS